MNLSKSCGYTEYLDVLSSMQFRSYRRRSMDCGRERVAKCVVDQRCGSVPGLFCAQNWDEL